MLKTKRKIVQMHESYVVTLPKHWILANGLSKGDIVEMLVEPRRITIKAGDRKDAGRDK